MLVNHYRTIAGEGRTSMEVYADNLARALALQPEAPTVVGVNAPAQTGRSSGGRSRLGRYIDRYLRYQLSAWGVQADVHHILDHGYGHLGFGLAARRTLVTFHDAMLLKIHARELPGGQTPGSAYYGHLLSLSAIRRAACVITPSASARDDLLRFVDYPADRVKVIPNGVSAAFFAQKGGTHERLAGPRRILHAGHCGPYKNVEALLTALPRIRDQLAEPVVLVKTGGAFTPAQERLIADLSIEESIQRLGHIPLAQLPDVYAEADLLVIPSLYEGFGLPALEAMAAGTPVVASDRGALPEVVGEAGILVDPTDVAGLADTVAATLAEPQLMTELSRRGVDRARAFSWERTGRETLALYQEVALQEAGRSRWQPIVP
jgi:glycosyltransferase involved in cell wall biosynthesis